MKRHKYSALFLAAMTCGVLWASAAYYTHTQAEAQAQAKALEAPVGLQLMGVNNKTVQLSWNSPERIDGYFDDFENHEDFAINSAGTVGWSYIDADNANTYTWQACTFPTQGDKMAFVVMNPWMTTPAVNENPEYQPYSGKKMLVDFCAVDVPNNDFLISPLLSFDSDFQISFMARSYKVGDNFAAERVRVGYSTTDKRPSDFTYVGEEPYVELPAAWTLVKYTIPREAKYVCINVVSNDAFMLMLDDLFVGTNKVRPAGVKKRQAEENPVIGFHVYRNGTRLTQQPQDSLRYTDLVPEYGDYSYTVSAVHQDGQESAQTAALKVNVPDIRLLPFFDDFDDWMMDETKWNQVNLDGNEESMWSVDYDEYGLVDAAATYKWSALLNYNQALMTQELNTPDQANTWLRFNLKLRNSEQTNLDYLELEVTSDDGKTWQTLDTYTNEKGAHDWTIKQYDLSKVLKSNLFRIRFRAHGADAKWINYWYVDDIKVWNPVWSKGQLKVTSGEGAMPNCPVTLTADHGAVIEATTDAQGQIQLDQLEVGTYEVEIIRPGYNVYHGTWGVSREGQNVFTAQLTAPRLDNETQTLARDMEAETTEESEFQFTNHGDGPVTWYLRENVNAGSGDATNRWQTLSSFTTSGDLQQSVAFDGEYYYTTSSVELGKFWKYDRQGKFIEQFSIPGMYYKLYDITYDGRYFYGSDWSNRIFQLDFDNRRVVDILNVTGVSGLKITHITYDPNYDGFWIGTFSTIGLVNRQGKFIRNISYLTQDNSVSIYGSAYDNVSPGGPYLWLSDMTSEREDKLDKIQLCQYSITKGALTGERHVLSDVPGYVLGSAETGANYVCGLFSSMDVVPGQLTLMGVLNQTPDLVFRYTLAQTNQWLSVFPKHGTLEPGQTQHIRVTMDALQTQQGDSREASVDLMTNPDVAEAKYIFRMNTNKPATTPRPQAVKAVAGTASVALTWEKGNGEAVANGYNVYRNHTRVNAEPIQGTQFTDTHLTYGNYTYEVTALYGEKESRESDSTQVFVQDGAQYYAPLGLTAGIQGNKHVHLTWQSPLALANQPDTMTWANGRHEDELGLASGGTFYVASKWDALDCVPYRGKKVSSISVQLVNTVTYLAARVYEDGKLLVSSRYRGEISYDGTFTDMPLSKDIVIKPGHEYLFAVQIMNDADVNPVSLDDAKAVNGKGNLLSLDAKEWFTAAETGVAGNFNIRVNVVPAEGAEEEAPVGYNVYRQGVRMNSQTVSGLSFDDVLTEKGTFDYTVTSVYADGGESAPSQKSTVEALNISTTTAPHHVDAQVLRNREVTLRWDNPTEDGEQLIPANLSVRPVTTAEGTPEFVNSFLGAKSSMAVATDGQYIYTSIYNEDGLIEKYTLEGQKVQGYRVDDVEGIRNLAYDGQFLYAADYTNDIHRIDPTTMKKVETIAISEYSRHLAYIPTLDGGNGGFETGDWETSIYVAKDGSKLGSGPALKGAAGTAYYDGKLYAFEQGNADNAYTIGIYDLQTKARVGSLNMGQYLEIENIAAYRAGGMSSFVGKDGITYLLLAMQRQNYQTLFVILDLSGLNSVAGYNVYRNGQLLTEEPLTRRYFGETMDVEGRYDYTVQTVYIDGTVSAQSVPVTAVIEALGEAKTPEFVKAQQSSYGYNVLLSFMDPKRYAGAASTLSFDELKDAEEALVAQGESYKSGWQVSTEVAFDGEKSILAPQKTETFGVIKSEGMKYLRLAARNADNHKGRATLNVYYSLGGTNRQNFIRLASYSVGEAWEDVLCELPQTADYIALGKGEGEPALYVDGVALYTEAPQTDCYGFQIYRNGELLTEEPVQGISYTDHNLTNGSYDYQVALVTVNSAVSALSEAVNVDLYHDNGSLAPTTLRVEDAGKERKLSWQAPALDQPIYLRWHNGYSHDAAGQSNGGAFFAGVNWFAEDLKDYGHLMLSDVEVYINQIPDALYVLVYENNALVRQQYVPSLRQYAFNNIHLDEPLQIDPNKNLRVAVYVEHNSITVPLGYDRGPARSGRGDLYSTDGVTWTTMSDSGSDIDANWNISIGLSPYANGPLKAQSRNAFLGYNVYRNGDLLNNELVSGTTYTDAKSYVGQYLEYQVAAVYSATGEHLSNKVTILATDIDGVQGEGLQVVANGHGIQLTGVQRGERIAVYTQDGKLVASRTAASNSEFVALAHQPRGTYLVCVGSHTVKVLVSAR